MFYVEEPAGTYKKRNDEMNLAWQFISSTNVSVFLTGKAGTGKTTFLKRISELTPKRMVVLAPTGVAAINAGGQTIHSFFQLPFGPYIPGMKTDDKNRRYKMSQQKKDLIRTLDLLVIDEVSMVRADLLDQIDNALREYRDRTKPFGGVQLLLIGDLMQLAPVAKPSEWAMLADRYDSPYFFSSHALKETQYVTIELKQIYRQQDDNFIGILAQIRNGAISPEVVEKLNQRYLPGFTEDGAHWIRLTTHNAPAQHFNESRLRALPGAPHTFEATIEGDFPELSYPTDLELTLKEGAQVMFVKNDPSIAHEYYNGRIGTIVAFTDEGIKVQCEGDDKCILVTPIVWENAKYELNPVTKAIQEKIVGTFTQIPLRLAWAITVHKSQGLTFDHAVLDINESFSHGQVYVALSRCRTLEGLVLSSPFSPVAVKTDFTVNQYIDAELSKVANSARQLPQYMLQYTVSLLDELYSFSNIYKDLHWMHRVVDEYFGVRLQLLLGWLKNACDELDAKVINVAGKFKLQYTQLIAEAGARFSDERLQKRISDSALYFSKQLHQIFDGLWQKLAINIENKQTAEIYKNAYNGLKQSVENKLKMLEHFCVEPFSTPEYLEEKARILLYAGISANTNRRNKAEKPQKEKKEKQPKEKKPPKINTLELTKALFAQGLSPQQIAAERGLAESTIYTHLTSLMGRGIVSIDEVISPERQRLINEALTNMEGAFSLTEVKEKLPEDISFHEIRMVIANNHNQL